MGVDVGCKNCSFDPEAAPLLLLRAQELVPVAINKAKEMKGFQGRWKMIIPKLEKIPSCLSDLSTHPFFSSNVLCLEQLRAVITTLDDAVKLADKCLLDMYHGKLRMQSDLDSLSGQLDLNLRDFCLLIKTNVLGDVISSPSSSCVSSESDVSVNIRELLARLQIGDLESKHKALAYLVEEMKLDDKNVLDAFGKSNVAALVRLLTTTSPRIREKSVTLIASLAESNSCENWLVSEGVIPPLIRLVESGSVFCKEKATTSLQKLSVSTYIARAVVSHGGIRPLIDICRVGDSVTQSAAAGTLKNISAVPELRQALAEEGIVRVMINLLDSGILTGSKEYAAECLQNLTCSNDSLRRSVISEGGVCSLLIYLEDPVPKESAVASVRNLVSAVPTDTLVSLGFLSCMVHVLKSGSLEAQHAAASALCRVISTAEMKKLVGEAGCIPHLINLLDAKTNAAREVAALVISNLMSLVDNCREVKKDEKSIPNLVRLLDPNPYNTAKKYAVSCLSMLSSSKNCKKLMISQGTIGYLKKLVELDTPGAKKLAERLERGKLRSLFSRRRG